MHLIDAQHLMHGDHGVADIGKFVFELLVAGVDDKRRVVVPHKIGDLDKAEQLTLIHLAHIHFVALAVANKLNPI